MEFLYNQKRSFSANAQRSVTMAPRSMAASSHHLATLAGHRAMARGGNAVDAAVAMVSTLNVVEPHSVGIGGDAFALIYLAEEDRLLGLNASGRAPYAATLEWYQENGHQTMPLRGILAATVPGALMGWAQAVEKYGRLSLAEVFEDAVYYAENGFPVTEVVSGEWSTVVEVLQKTPSAAKTFLIDGKAPRPGQVFKNPDLGRTLKRIGREGIELFYGGEIGQAIAAYAQSRGGLLSVKDLADHTVTWVEPISLDYRGHTVFELPPNGQGLTALEMLNILQGYDLGSLDHNSAEYLHLLIEAKKLAFADRDYYITDPEMEEVPVATLLSPEFGQKCRDRISPDGVLDFKGPSLAPPSSETVYVTAVDQDRNAVSFISSVFMAFGSGEVVKDTGIALQNRGASFSLDKTHPNRLVPGKRPMHTIIPGMVFKDGKFMMSFGVMGGDMQPQGHVQFLANLIDFKMNLQEALDAPRFRHMEGLSVYLEEGMPPETSSGLEAKGHLLDQTPYPTNEVGGGQAVYLDRSQNVLLGASDRRKDGCAVGY